MLSLWLRRVAIHALISGLLLFCGYAMASGLQVSPVSLNLQAKQNASGLTLSNTSDDVLHAQVRVYLWSQDENGDQLTPSRGLLASPPIVALNPGEEQLVRIIRAQPPSQAAKAVENTYRLLINELPIDSPNKKSGLQFSLNYSLPIFVKPAGGLETSPKLQWYYNLQPEGKQMELRVSNSGTGHAQLSDLSFEDAAGNSVDIHQGLLGYVLPGATMQWILRVEPSAFATGTIDSKFKVTINGTQTMQEITLDTITR